MEKFSIGSLLKKADRNRAAKLLAVGEIIGIFNRGVCALWFDGANSKTVERIWTIKGEGRKNRSLALTLQLEEFVSMIDTSRLPSNLKDLIEASDFKLKVGSLCFIRAPIKKSHQKSIPSQAKNIDSDGVCMVQNWDPHGHEPIEEFLKEVRDLGVKYPAVTSMNITRQKEIVDQIEAEKFCRDHIIPIFLKDPKARLNHKGSYTIFTFGPKGINLEREGNIPSRLFKKIFGINVYTKGAKKANHQQLKFPDKIFGKLTGAKVREAILLYLQGRTYG